MLRRDADHPTDPVVLLWDAVAAGPPPAQGEHAGIHGLISDFLALDDTPMPDPTFLNRLEAQVISAGAKQRSPVGFSINALNALRPDVPASVRKRFQQESPSRRRLAGYGRWAATQAAMAMLLLIVLGGVGVIYMTGSLHDSEPTLPSTGGGEIISAPVTGGQSQDLPMTGGPGNDSGLIGGSPAVAVQPEPIITLEIDPASLGAAPADTWNALEFAEVHVLPGEGFRTDAPFFAAIPGIAVFHVVEGNLHLTVDGPTDVYRMGSGVPERIPAGTPMNLAQDDTAVFAIESIATVENSEDTELVMLAGYASNLTEMSGSNTVPAGYVDPFWAVGRNIEPLAPGPVTISYERWPLPPGGLTHIEVREGDRGLGWNNQAGNAIRMLPGRYDQLPEEPGTITPRLMLEDLEPGDYTFFNPHDEPLTFYLMRVDQPGGSTTQAATQPESLIRFSTDPAELPIGSPENWNQVYFEVGYVEPGAVYEMGQREITCCRPGLAAIHIRQGSASIELAGQSYVVRPGQDPASPEVHDASTPVVLTSGDTIWYNVESHPAIANSGPDQLVLLSLGAVERINPGTGSSGSLPPGYVRTSLALSTGSTLLQTGSAETSIERIELQPNDAFHFTASGDRYAMVLIEEGRIHYYKDTGNGPPHPSLIHTRGPSLEINFHEHAAGDYVLENPYDEPAVMYLLTMANAPDAGSDDFSSAMATPLSSQASSESLLSAVIDPTSVGAESQSSWQSAALATVTLSPGMQFAPQDSNWGDALDAFVLLEGAVTVESATPSQIVRASSEQPEPLDAGMSADLAPGDTWLAGIGESFSMTNNGSDEATLMLFHHGVAQSLFGFGAGTIGLYPPGFRPDLHAENPTPLTFDGPVSLSLERVTVNTGETFRLDVTGDELLLLANTDGRAMRATQDGSSTPLTLLGGAALNLYSPGAYIISHLYGDAPLTLYIARMSDAPAVASDAAATPAAESASPVTQQAVTEELVQFLADPASSPIGNPEAWDEVVAEIGQLEPGASFDASLRNLTCCRFGLGALHIFDGTTSVELSGPSSVIRAGQDPATPELYEPSTDIALGPGDTIWYGIEARPFVTNTGSTDLTLLNFSVHDFAGDASVEGRLDTYRRPGYAMKSNIYTSDELPLQPGIASTSIQRINLDPEETFILTVSENQRQVALIAQGTIQFHKDTGDKPVPPALITSRGVGLGTAFHTFAPGDYIIENNKDDPATLYVLTITTIPD